jgi:hypothetical protein
MSRLTAAPQSRHQGRHEWQRRSGHVGDELAVEPISWSQRSAYFSVRFSRRASRGVPPLTIGGPRHSTGFGDPPPQIDQRRHVPSGAPVSVAHEGPDRDGPPPPKEPEISRPIGTCRVRHCAGTTTQRRRTPRTMSLPGTPREARPRLVLPVSREAAARPNSVVAALHSTTRATTLFGRRWDAKGGPEGRSRRSAGAAPNIDQTQRITWVERSRRPRPPNLALSCAATAPHALESVLMRCNGYPWRPWHRKRSSLV